MNELIVTNKKELPLPKFNQPSNLDKAAFLINQLGKNIHEHAYLVGKILVWVKKAVRHGEFEDWVKKNEVVKVQLLLFFLNLICVH